MGQPSTDGQEQQQQWSGDNLRLGDSLCRLQWVETEVTQALWRSPEVCEWILGIGHAVIYTVEVWFYFVHIVTMPWFFPLYITSSQPVDHAYQISSYQIFTL
ncbi:hypothetical protein I79_009683 [Cricetulus griseus]|uniref:Uncharacterized protein n=1 Tax=Cricetulus griseus TaxID=10029 RepID=G3HGF7_CRIGR|nr:hypothetical protein I79_009683 [Cricetulus griseus]